MKYIIYILLILLILFTVGCTKYVKSDPEPVIETVVKTVVVTETVIETVEVKDSQCIDLIDNLNYLLSNVYYVYGKNEYSDHYTESWGTGFSLEYNDNYYLITAGHIVENEIDYFPDLGFKNKDDEWIYPELLIFENGFDISKDYAVFYSDEINNGFIPNEEFTYPAFILGHGGELEEGKYNIIKPKEENIMDMDISIGESGSPIINTDGEVLSIFTGALTLIKVVLEAIDNM